MGSSVIGNQEEEVVPTMIKLYRPYGFISETRSERNALKKLSPLWDVRQ